VLHASHARWLVVAWSTLAACANVDTGACGGPAPLIEECDYGKTWADCGGTGAASTFACPTRSGCVGCPPFGCRWFARGCVAQGYDASACSATNLCCVATSGSHAGMPYDVSVASEHTSDVASFTAAWGTAVWDVEREANLDVSIGRPSTSGGPFRCSNDRLSPICSRSTIVELGSSGGSVGVAVVRDVTTAPAPYPNYAVLEVMGVGPRSARLCLVDPSADFESSACQPLHTTECASGGTVVLSAAPGGGATGLADVSLEVDAMFGTSSIIMTR